MDTEQQLIEACDKAIEHGWTIKRNTTVDIQNKCCCPYGAFALNYFGFDIDRLIIGLQNQVTIFEIVQRTPIKYIDGFITMFDKYPGPVKYDGYSAGAALRLRKKYCP